MPYQPQKGCRAEQKGDGELCPEHARSAVRGAKADIGTANQSKRDRSKSYRALLIQKKVSRQCENDKQHANPYGRFQDIPVSMVRYVIACLFENLCHGFVPRDSSNWKVKGYSSTRATQRSLNRSTVRSKDRYQDVFDADAKLMSDARGDFQSSFAFCQTCWQAE